MVKKYNTTFIEILSELLKSNVSGIARFFCGLSSNKTRPTFGNLRHDLYYLNHAQRVLLQKQIDNLDFMIDLRLDSLGFNYDNSTIHQHSKSSLNYDIEFNHIVIEIDFPEREKDSKIEIKEYVHKNHYEQFLFWYVREFFIGSPDNIFYSRPNGITIDELIEDRVTEFYLKQEDLVMLYPQAIRKKREDLLKSKKSFFLLLPHFSSNGILSEAISTMINQDKQFTLEEFEKLKEDYEIAEKIKKHPLSLDQFTPVEQDFICLTSFGVFGIFKEFFQLTEELTYRFEYLKQSGDITRNSHQNHKETKPEKSLIKLYKDYAGVTDLMLTQSQQLKDLIEKHDFLLELFIADYLRKVFSKVLQVSEIFEFIRHAVQNIPIKEKHKNFYIDGTTDYSPLAHHVFQADEKFYRLLSTGEIMHNGFFVPVYLGKESPLYKRLKEGIAKICCQYALVERNIVNLELYSTYWLKLLNNLYYNLGKEQINQIDITDFRNKYIKPMIEDSKEYKTANDQQKKNLLGAINLELLSDCLKKPNNSLSAGNFYPNDNDLILLHEYSTPHLVLLNETYKHFGNEGLKNTTKIEIEQYMQEFNKNQFNSLIATSKITHIAKILRTLEQAVGSGNRTPKAKKLSVD